MKCIISHKSCIPWDAMDLMNYLNSRGSWVQLLQQSPAGTIFKKPQLTCFNFEILCCFRHPRNFQGDVKPFFFFGQSW